MKLALYKSVKYGHDNVYEADNYYENSSDLVRVSEIVEVDFPPIKKEEYAEKMMAAFDAEEKNIRLELAEKLAQINQRRQEFMAISHSKEQ